MWLRLLAGIATALMQISTPAAADDITIDTAPFQSSATRAEVRAQLQQFKKAGPPPWSISYNPLQGFKSTRSREEVRREMAASRDEMRALYGEDSGSIILRQPVPR
ncbi:DUF4148 domain-containing protein [uncultured Ramlibacter sp.]|uniref:DUF4148 domain-containing protein n=1 Tax=uncultured Ramlibacter sp. TaxID=260755 RepID=UPI002628C80D|nr:DUF4148 domain-containing protein [uncultured Ramlibacter sp.]